MCVVSMAGDVYKPNWPLPQQPLDWSGITFTPAQEATALEKFEELMKVAKELDALLGLPDCEDPEKTGWLEEVRERVREHERAKVDERLGG